MAVRILKGAHWVDFRFCGKRYRLKSPSNSRRKAESYEALIKKKLLSGEPVKTLEEKRAPTFTEYANEWQRTYVRANNKPSEQISKDQNLKHHLIPFFGKKRLDEIKTAHVEAYKANKQISGLSNKTVNNHLATLSKLMNCAADWGYIPFATLPRIKRLKVFSQRLEFLNPRESFQLLQIRDEPMWHLMVFMALRTGMRFGELLGLTWEDIDFDHDIITIQRSVVHGIVSMPKNHKIRHIRIAPELKEELWGYPRTHEYVFRVDGYTFISHPMARNALKRMCKKAGIKKIGWHTLRHTFASQLAAYGIPIIAIKELLGHSSIEMTMRYAHLAPSDVQSAVLKLRMIEIEAVIKSGHPMGTSPLPELLDNKNTCISASVLDSPATGYSPRTGLGPSTIAADELNFRVRDGNGCDLIA